MSDDKLRIWESRIYDEIKRLKDEVTKNPNDGAMIQKIQIEIDMLEWVLRTKPY